MILFDEEPTTEAAASDQPQQPIIVDSGSDLTYEDIYNAVYNGYMAAYTDIKVNEIEEQKKQEEEEQLEKDKEALLKETTPEPIYKVNVENVGEVTSVNVKNMPDSFVDYASLSDAVNVNNDPALEFATDTDARLYTASVSVPPSTASGQTAAYMLDVRNILFIFLLLWFSVYMIKMLKDTVIKVSNKRKGVK